MDPDRLKTIPLFSSLSDKALDTLSVFATETSVSAGKRLVHEGDYSYDLIVIETGSADVLKGGEVIGSLGPGDVFGEMGMLSGAKRSADVIATSPSANGISSASPARSATSYSRSSSSAKSSTRSALNLRSCLGVREPTCGRGSGGWRRCPTAWC
jgi:hypothetical protein